MQRIKSFTFIISFPLLLISLVTWNNTCAQSELSFDIFTLENGLPNNQIQCIYQDSKGWIWVGTSQGLCTFNGYDFSSFHPSRDDSTSISGSLIRVIKEDSRGNLLVGTENGGLNIFDRKKEIFTQPCKNISEIHVGEFSVNDIIEDKSGKFWLATDFGLIILDKTGKVTALNPILKNNTQSLKGVFLRNLKFDSNGLLWIGSDEGLFIYNPKNNTLEAINLPLANTTNKEIWELYLDEEGFMWVGTYSSGLFMVNTQTKMAQKIQLEPAILRTEVVRAISKGQYGEYWIGTRGGLFRYSKTGGVKAFYQKNLLEPKSLSNNSVLSVLHDKNGDTWIGTRGGLNLLAKSKQVFHNYTALSGSNNHLNSSAVYALWVDDNEKIWVGTEDGGINIYDSKTNTYEYLTANSNANNSISQNCIKSLTEDGKGNLWVGTYLGGIDVINLKTRKITNYKHEVDIAGSLSDNRIWDICVDKDGNKWIASWKGVDKFDDNTSTFTHYPQLFGNESVLWIKPDSKGNLWMGSGNEIIIFNPNTNRIKRWFERTRSMFEDSNNQIWVGTMDRGLAMYTADSGAVKYYNESNGLANNQVLRILEDDSNNLWISTTNGLSKFDYINEVFQTFTSKDGLSNNQFCYGASFRTKSGEMLFGTISGFNSFHPDEIEEPNLDVPLVFTDLKIFNKSVPINEGKKPILSASISETHHLVFNHKQNVFTLEFAALNYVNSENNLYTYKLEGFNTDWNEPSKDRTATYTNLNPGDYTLRIKRVFAGDQQATKELQLAIKVLPPFWKTNWFLVLLFLWSIVLIYIIIRFFVNREKIKSQLIIERANARKLHEVDMMKLKFFTNISHEIRTPLSLILGPLNKLLESKSTDPGTREDLKLMQRNTKNLDRLISQLLDFRKLQSGNLKLNLTEADIVSFVRNIVNSFSEHATEKGINLHFNTLKKQLFIAFDPDKVQKIVNNLLSNAFKYTNNNGSVSVNLSLIFDSDDDDFGDEIEERQFVEISIKDTGKGIPQKNIDKIFVRFFQSEENDNNSGSGIGLALVKDLVKLHKGKIYVTSKEGKGTKFTIRIPYDLKIDNDISAGKIETKNETSVILNDLDSANQDIQADSKIMLIVEDNDDVRRFISSHFSSMYHIYQSIDGQEGWEKALEVVPDIIISDIIMPDTDGYELCKRIKTDERTSHIPLILLTAMHSKEHELKGLTKGADDYITKPFDLSVLEAKVENILSIRESLKEKYTSKMVLEPTNVVLKSPDEKFLKRVVDAVEENISDSELDIENFSRKVGVSRMQLYRKLHALTNMTVKEFIRHIRLKRATQLLDQQNLNISEIAYEVGFKDLSHFRKCFKREFGMSATEYLSHKKEKTTKAS